MRARCSANCSPTRSGTLARAVTVESDIDVTVDDQHVRLAVADGGSVTVPSLVSPTPTRVSGRGLSIVHSLTSDWGVQERADGNTVFGILSRT